MNMLLHSNTSYRVLGLFLTNVKCFMGHCRFQYCFGCMVHYCDEMSIVSFICLFMFFHLILAFLLFILLGCTPNHDASITRFHFFFLKVKLKRLHLCCIAKTTQVTQLIVRTLNQDTEKNFLFLKKPMLNVLGKMIHVKNMIHVIKQIFLKI